MSTSPIPDLDCGFSSFDDLIESIIPDDAFTYSESIAICNPNTVQKNAVHCGGIHHEGEETKLETKVVKPKAQIADSNTIMQLMTSFVDNMETQRSCTRSASTSSIVMSPPLSPNCEQPHFTSKQKDENAFFPMRNEEGFSNSIEGGAFAPWEPKKICAKNYRYDPKPLMRKNKRQLVPDDEKTHKYWMKRSRNNKAARKSREDRRQKELEVLQTMNLLQDENTRLKMYMSNLLKTNEEFQQEIIRMRQQLELAGFFVPSNTT
ncbi:uncharacterized protein LOC130657046 [Hydractinia symbiolongicarpus]|uniref:uncharacterized protein LOC130657046 n=1 Tax=Hydractinia symbiolongicarpus TaxID=13093 RepID=UPI00254A5987|nr:uncharacterized protein LOC130657046 [Hydractinia symbiolongicarpus]